MEGALLDITCVCGGGNPPNRVSGWYVVIVIFTFKITIVIVKSGTVGRFIVTGNFRILNHLQLLSIFIVIDRAVRIVHRFRIRGGCAGVVAHI